MSSSLPTCPRVPRGDDFDQLYFCCLHRLGDNTAQEDSRALVRTLMLNNFSPQTPTFVQLSDPSGLFQVLL